MKIKLLAFIGGIILPVICLAQFDPGQWRYYKDIEGGAGEVRKFILDDEIFSGARKDLGDLRIANQEGKEIPYKIVLSEKDLGNVYAQAKLINNSYVPGQYSMAILDLGERGKITNNLSINTISENFQRNVKIYGSDDISNWQTILDNGYIYDYTDKKGNFKSQNTRVNFADSIFRYIKVEISDDGFPIKIDSVAIRQNIMKQSLTSDRRVKYEVRENLDRKLTEIISDLGVDGLPLNKIYFKIPEANFNRGVVVYSSSDREKWQYLSQGYIFRYDTSKFSGVNLEASFPETNNRFLKVEIMNNDNAPLSISEMSVSTVWREVVFPDEKKDQSLGFRVYYGNPKAGGPKYDLDKYIQYLNTSGTQYARISSQKENPGFVPEKEPEKPLTERVPYLLPLALSLSSLFLIFLVYKFLKK